MIESITDVLFFWLGSLYELSKIAFYVYLFSPQMQGAIFLYDRLLKEWVAKSLVYTDSIKEDVKGIASVFDKKTDGDETKKTS